MRLTDRVAIVTGGGRGLGAAIARAFASEGARVVVAARTEKELRSVATDIANDGGQAEICVSDVSDRQDAERVVANASQYFGPVDVLVNAAGMYGPIGPTWEASVEEWTRAVKVNLLGTFHCCHAALPQMVERRTGKIINFSGGGATAPLARFSAYGVSKAAVVRLTETLAVEVAEKGIQVNVIAPGMVDTSLQDEVLAAGDQAGDLYQRVQELRASGAGGTPPEMATQLATYLASDESKGLTGKLIAAPHDDWRSWTPANLQDLTQSPWLTLRRLDEHTLSELPPYPNR